MKKLCAVPDPHSTNGIFSDLNLYVIRGVAGRPLSIPPAQQNAYRTSCPRSALGHPWPSSNGRGPYAQIVPRIPSEWQRKGCACYVSAFGGFFTYFLYWNNLKLTGMLQAWGSSPLLCVQGIFIYHIFSRKIFRIQTNPAPTPVRTDRPPCLSLTRAHPNPHAWPWPPRPSWNPHPPDTNKRVGHYLSQVVWYNKPFWKNLYLLIQ